MGDLLLMPEAECDPARSVDSIMAAFRGPSPPEAEVVLAAFTAADSMAAVAFMVVEAGDSANEAIQNEVRI
jgi:hypothetical protein